MVELIIQKADSRATQLVVVGLIQTRSAGRYSHVSPGGTLTSIDVELSSHSSCYVDPVSTKVVEEQHHRLACVVSHNDVIVQKRDR